MNDEVIEYPGIFCFKHIPWIIFGLASIIVLISHHYYITTWYLLIVGVISLILWIRCTYKKPKVLAVIDSSSITVNNEKSSNKIAANEIDYAIKRMFHVEIRKRDGSKLKIPNGYFVVSKDIESFVINVNSIADKSY